MTKPASDCASMDKAYGGAPRQKPERINLTRAQPGELLKKLRELNAYLEAAEDACLFTPALRTRLEMLNEYISVTSEIITRMETKLRQTPR